MITIDWPTRLITVPQSFLTLVSPGVYELDTNEFRLALKALEESPEGMTYPDATKHTEPVILGGVSYSRFVEMINNYRVEFEDGPYTVNLSGSNNNIADVSVYNQVRVSPNNAVGLVTVEREVDLADLIPYFRQLEAHVWASSDQYGLQVNGLDPTP